MEKIELQKLATETGRFWYASRDFTDKDKGDPLFVYPANEVDALVEAARELNNKFGLVDEATLITLVIKMKSALKPFEQSGNTETLEEKP